MEKLSDEEMIIALLDGMNEEGVGRMKIRMSERLPEGQMSTSPTMGTCDMSGAAALGSCQMTSLFEGKGETDGNKSDQ